MGRTLCRLLIVLAIGVFAPLPSQAQRFATDACDNGWMVWEVQSIRGRAITVGVPGTRYSIESRVRFDVRQGLRLLQGTHGHDVTGMAFEIKCRVDSRTGAVAHDDPFARIEALARDAELIYGTRNARSAQPRTPQHNTSSIPRNEGRMPPARDSHARQAETASRT